MKIIKKDERGKVYQAKDFKIIYRNQNSISGDNDVNKKELIYLITGTAEIVINNKSESFNSPAKIEIPENTYHKIKAITDISFILFN